MPAPSWNRRLAALTQVLAQVLALATAGCASAPPPMVMRAGFTDSGPARPTSGPRCKVHVASLSDARRAPDILAVMNRRAIKSPPDVQAWLRAVVGGLDARGIEVGFAPEAAASAHAVEARISLVTAWVAPMSTNFNASAVLHLSARGPDGRQIERDYRGGRTRLNWAGGADEVQRMIDLSLADALDLMAADLRPLCSG